MSIVIGTILGLIPQCIIMLIHYKNFKASPLVMLRETDIFIRPTELLDEDTTDTEDQNLTPEVNYSDRHESYQQNII